MRQRNARAAPHDEHLPRKYIARPYIMYIDSMTTHDRRDPHGTNDINECYDHGLRARADAADSKRASRTARLAPIPRRSRGQARAARQRFEPDGRPHGLTRNHRSRKR